MPVIHERVGQRPCGSVSFEGKLPELFGIRSPAMGQAMSYRPPVVKGYMQMTLEVAST